MYFLNFFWTSAKIIHNSQKKLKLKLGLSKGVKAMIIIYQLGLK